VNNVQGPTSVTANFVANNLTIASPQTSTAVGKPFPVTVSLTGVDALVTLTPTNCPDNTVLTAAGTSAVPASFTLTFGAVSTTCSLKATASNYNDSGSLPVTVFAVGSLACGPVNAPSGANNTIIASADGVTSINQPGFAEGVRGSNTAVNKDNSANTAPCDFVNWTFTNNVLGTSGPTVDAKGNTIPANGVSFVWDQTYQPNAAYSYTVTWQAEWFGLASPNNRKTQFCTGSGPTACDSANLVFAQACLNPALERASIPVGAPACVSAEVWGVVDPGKCAALTALAGQTTCVVFTTTITDIKDPPIIRN
jgi:hypothetical protein